MKEFYDTPELKVISFVPEEKLASSTDIGFGDIALGNGMSNEQAPIESTDISIDF